MRTANCLSGCFVNWGTDRSDEHKQTGCTDILSVCPPVDFFLCSIGHLFHRRWLFYWKSVGGCGAFCCDDRLPYRGVYPGGGDWAGYGRRNLFFHRACKRTRQRSKQVNRHSKLADARIQRALNDPCSVLQRPYAKTFGRKWEYVTSGAGVHCHHFIRNGFADFRHRSRPIHP